MKDFFETYAHLYEGNYSIESWIIWISLYIQYFGYYFCFYLGFAVLVMLTIAPFVGLAGLFYNIRIKIKHKKQKKLEYSIKNKMQNGYINTLDNISKKRKCNNKKKKKKKHI